VVQELLPGQVELALLEAPAELVLLEPGVL